MPEKRSEKRSEKWVGLAVRTPAKTVKAFDERAEMHGKSRSDMLKEIISAFIEGRLAIRVKPTIQKANEELYK